eukprot:gene15241-18040_t
MKRVKSFWRKDTKANIKYNGSGSKRVFGAGLDPKHPIVPEIIVATTRYIEEFGLNEHGLFRVSGHVSEVNRFKSAFERGESVDLSLCSNPHVVTGVLKQYLRELPEPLFPFAYYDALIASHGVTDPEMRLTCIKNIILKVPDHFLVVLDYLIAFLHRIDGHKMSHKMDAANLAIVFAPNLLRAKSETAEQIVSDSPKATLIIKIIIEHYQAMFERDPWTGEFIEADQDDVEQQEFFSEDYLLPTTYETINLDKEIAAIFAEEVDVILSRAIDTPPHPAAQSDASIDPRTSLFSALNIPYDLDGGYPDTAGLNISMDDEPPSIYIDGVPSSLVPAGHTGNMRISLASTTSSSCEHESSISSPDISIESDGDLATPEPAVPAAATPEPDAKLVAIKMLVDDAIAKLEREFLQLANDIKGELSIQEIILIASSMKNIMSILKEGPDVDFRVVSSLDMDIGAFMAAGEHIKRLETLRQVIQYRTERVPVALQHLRDEAEGLIACDEAVEHEVSLVGLISIMRTLKAVGGILDFLFSKWRGSEVEDDADSQHAPTDEQEIIQKLEDVESVLRATEETLVKVTSRGELLFIAKIVQNLHKITKMPVAHAATFDDIPAPKDNTLKITPKKKLAPLISVVFVLLKEIQDDVRQSKIVLIAQSNSTITSPEVVNDSLSAYNRRVSDINRLLSRLPAFHCLPPHPTPSSAASLQPPNNHRVTFSSDEEDHNNSSVDENVVAMRSTVQGAISRLKPLLSGLLSELERPDVELSKAMKISRAITQMKKVVEDPDVAVRTGVRFKANLHRSITLSNEMINSQTTESKIDALKALSAGFVENIVLKLDYLNRRLPIIKDEDHMYEIINLLKSLIETIRETKL